MAKLKKNYLNTSYTDIKSHIKLKVDHGITKEEVAEMVTQLAFYTCWAKVWNTFPIIDEIYNSKE